jgi:molecular chaperone HtpG
MYFTFKTAVTLSVTKKGLELPDDDEETKKRESDKAKFDALAW